MEMLVWIGAAVSLAGLLGLMGCIFKVFRARMQQLPEDEMRAVVQKVLPYNMGALMLSVLGLVMVITGIFLS
jgi:hypothetical protein